VSKTAVAFAAALGVGLLAGLLYWIMGVPTPAPPWWALSGLLGIVGGETSVAAVLHWRGRRRRGPHAPQVHASPNKRPAL